jgi:hypothetical protein
MNNNSQLWPVEVESGNDGGDETGRVKVNEGVVATQTQVVAMLGAANRLTTPKIRVRARAVNSRRQRDHIRTVPCTGE